MKPEAGRPNHNCSDAYLFRHEKLPSVILKHDNNTVFKSLLMANLLGHFLLFSSTSTSGDYLAFFKRVGTQPHNRKL